MRANTKGLTFSLVASAAALSLAASTAPAVADPSAPVHIGRAETDQRQRGSFSVIAASDAAGATVTSVSATVRRGDTVVAEVASLTPHAKPDRFTVPADAPLKLTEDGGTIPELGRYTIDVTATDSAGNTETRRNAGTLDFTLRPELTLTASKPTWQDRSARPHGRLTGVQPGSGDEVALPGRTVDVSRTDGVNDTTHAVTTSANGEFTAPAFPLTAPRGTFRAAFFESGVPVQGAVTRDAVITEYEQRPVNLTATADRARVLPGEKATVSGRVLYGTAPAAGVAVRIRLTHGTTESHFDTTVTTDRNGRFTARVAAMPQRRLDGWVARPVDGFLGGSATGKLAHPAAATIEVHKATLAADGQVKVRGQIRTASESGLHTPGPHAVRIERSADGRTGWKQVGSGQTVGRIFTKLTGKVTAGGYFRVRHPLSDAFLDTTSPVVHLPRTETRIVSVNATPEPVRKGAKLTVTGTAGEKVGTVWKALAAKPVELWFQPKGSTTWSRVTRATTNAEGRASFTAKAQESGTWTIRYYGNTTRLDSVATGDVVEVR
ncbi:hypothetical protein ABT354_00345 [Streptomyces sp. NPDC000594]|uniref:hypothetical protein n=1 Tax=Streptomyces sp. NPDC000594 TaxID=3154261 RepID=UPI00332E7E8B